VNADLSVAPEIAQLAVPLAKLPATPGPAWWRGATTGQLATGLSRLAATPQRWWDLVRFNPDRPARIAVPAPFEAWLLVIPPGQGAPCDCELATQLAGEALEGTARLRPGRVRVHGLSAHHHIRSLGHGYSLSLHGAVARGR
jgi:hypothetical protein